MTTKSEKTDPLQQSAARVYDNAVRWLVRSRANPKREYFVDVAEHGGNGSCGIRATQIHHTKRRGPHLNDEHSFCGCCNDCHRWIETHAQKSRDLGLLLK